MNMTQGFSMRNITNNERIISTHRMTKDQSLSQISELQMKREFNRDKSKKPDEYLSIMNMKKSFLSDNEQKKKSQDGEDEPIYNASGSANSEDLEVSEENEASSNSLSQPNKAKQASIKKTKRKLQSKMRQTNEPIVLKNDRHNKMKDTSGYPRTQK